MATRRRSQPQQQSKMHPMLRDVFIGLGQIGARAASKAVASVAKDSGQILDKLRKSASEIEQGFEAFAQAISPSRGQNEQRNDEEEE